ncbi:rhamnulokinase [Athalassotoga saccharophila]|uniref:rhamnulokinase n=1 Tax=Athalassotoga saccharophila TaxID=1441386 RepID=UPI001379C7B0|nr:FGGY-family carbohydrate kinase [Athalassotoga saccharophila]BBJ27372.1 L-Rhamnulokinase [Athalassotoga saccharophila]
MNFLAIDIGASGGKAFLLSLKDKIHIEEIYRFPNISVNLNGVDYWNILEIYSNILKAIDIALQKGDLGSVGIDTWGVDFGLLDKSGYMIGMPMHYRNAYKFNSMSKALDKVGKRWIFDRSPTQFQPFNTLYQIIGMKDLKMKSIECANTLLGMPSLFVYFLTGRKAIEFTFATTTQIYNPYLKDWDKEIIRTFDLPDIFPEIVSPSTIVGDTKLSGKKFKIVFPATHDTGSAFACVNDENAMIISAGTWFLEGILSKMPVKNEDVMKYNLANEGCIDGGYRLLSNVTGMWLIEELRRKWNGIEYERLIEMAKSAQPFSGMIDVDSSDLQKPEDMEFEIIKESMRFSGKKIASKEEVVRTAFEGITLKTRWSLERLEKLSGKKIKEIRIIGGATRNKLICQFISNATGLTVEAGPIEATAIGNGLSQMIANGQITLSDIPDLVGRSFEISRYDPQNAEEWQKAYEKWEMAYGK